MFALKVFVKGWLPVLACMAAIFIGSTDLLASHNTSRWIGPILHWLKPDISDETVARIQYGIRKTGHLSEYALLALLLRNALHLRAQVPWHHWDSKKALLALALAALYAVSDEYHQSFISTRYASAWDVLIDTVGGATALLLAFAWLRLRHHAPE